MEPGLEALEKGFTALPGQCGAVFASGALVEKGRVVHLAAFRTRAASLD